MTDPVPSKERISFLAEYWAAKLESHKRWPEGQGLHADLMSLIYKDTITALKQMQLAEPKPAHEREPPHCSTCACGLAPEPAAVPVSILREHWLTGVECDHDAKTDVATCYCSRWRSTPQANIPTAVDEWIKHLLEQQPASAQPPRDG